MRLNTTGLFLCGALIIGCGGDDSPQAMARTPSPDSAAGEVTQFALMKNQVGWLTDSNAVALAALVNQAGAEIARLETQEWTNETMRALASMIVREHNAFQYSIDSLAQKLRIPSQAPAIGAEMRVGYDSLLNGFAAFTLAQRESAFVDAVARQHARTTMDFAAIAGNTGDPDLRALIMNKGILMEQTHIARVQLLAAAVARADSAESAKQDSIQKARRGRSR